MAKAGHFAALKTSLWCLGLSFTREEAKVCSGARQREEWRSRAADALEDVRRRAAQLRK